MPLATAVGCPGFCCGGAALPRARVYRFLFAARVLSCACMSIFCLGLCLLLIENYILARAAPYSRSDGPEIRMITACARAACSWGGVVGVVVSLRLGEWPGACCKSQIPGTPAIPKHAHAAPDNHPEKKGERNDEIKNAPHEKSLQTICSTSLCRPSGRD